jgi:hypothetical protein
MVDAPDKVTHKLENLSPGQWYLSLLGGFLSWLSSVIGDSEEARRQSAAPACRTKRRPCCNPWTAESYEVCLRLALIFLVLASAATVSAVALANRLAVLGGGVAIVNLDGLLLDIRVDPGNPGHWWIYLMLLTTLIPTLLHMLIASIAFVLWLGHFAPLSNWRQRAAIDLERDGDQRKGAALYLTLVPAVGFALSVGLLYLGYRLYPAIWDADLFARLLDLMRAIAAAIDPRMPGSI